MTRPRVSTADALLAGLPPSLRALNPQLPAARPKRPRRPALVAGAVPLAAIVDAVAVGAAVERVAVTLPGLRLVNPLNRRQHWRAVWQRGKRDHRAVSAALCSVDPVALPAVVTIVRVGGGTMDGDGLAASAKHVRDAVAGVRRRRRPRAVAVRAGARGARGAGRGADGEERGTMSKHISFERHRDDEWVDGVTFTTDGDTEALRVDVVPRYKTSGLSGDEWRVSSLITLRALGGATVAELGGYHYVRDACARLPGLLVAPESRDGAGVQRAAWHGVPGTLRLWRKGRLCLERRFSQMADAVATLPWTLVVSGEARDWKSVSTDDLCMQAGCAAPFAVEYRLKQLYAGPMNAPLPASPWSESRRRFCARHSTRGDCGVEDADDNYERVTGAPTTPPTSDVAPSRVVMVSADELLTDPAGTLDMVRGAVARGDGPSDA